MQCFITKFCCLPLALLELFAFQGYHDLLVSTHASIKKCKLTTDIHVAGLDGKELLYISLHRLLIFVDVWVFWTHFLLLCPLRRIGGEWEKL